MPSAPEQAILFGVTTWDADDERTLVGLAVAQLFGGMSAPLNFSRYPDWCTWVCSVFFLVLFWQCVDDLINIERSSTVASAREAWLAFASLCGWDIPLAKSPLPSQYFRALGVFVDLRPLPCSTAYIQVCPLRIDGILEMMVAILERNRLPSGLASSLVGRLMFACVAFPAYMASRCSARFDVVRAKLVQTSTRRFVQPWGGGAASYAVHPPALYRGWSNPAVSL